jgi:hypothetical protein
MSTKLRPSNASTAAPDTVVTGASGHEYHGHWGDKYKSWKTEVTLGGAEAEIKVVSAPERPSTAVGR